MIQLTDLVCVLLGIMGSAISDYNMRLILLTVIQLSGGHCKTIEPNIFQLITLFKPYSGWSTSKQMYQS